jgi:hypothetical protein
VALDKIQLRGHLHSLKEWYEGFEELEAIPHSFVILFHDGQGAWSMFTDSEEEKVVLLPRPSCHDQHLTSFLHR